MNKLKYLGYGIVFQEVPDEVTLAINISGCPHKCEGCHSKYLWEYEGNYISEDLDDLIKKYQGLITCVCFMGGDQNQIDLLGLLKTVQKYGLKTALYTGLGLVNNLSMRILGNLNYLKTGKYDSSLGGLDCPTTNQRMFKWNYSTMRWDDITYRFQKR
jgi:anaerobic ribonucleoside-triphosphate reductase activating protein